MFSLLHYLPQLSFVPPNPAAHAISVLTLSVQDTIQGGKIQIHEAHLSSLNRTTSRLKILFFTGAPVGPVMRDTRSPQMVKYGGHATINAARFEDVAFLGVIEAVQVLERHVVELEVACKAVEMLEILAHTTAHPAPPGDKPRYQIEDPVVSEGGPAVGLGEEREVLCDTIEEFYQVQNVIDAAYEFGVDVSYANPLVSQDAGVV